MRDARGSEVHQLATSMLTILLQCPDLPIDQAFQTVVSFYQSGPRGSEARQFATSILLTLLSHSDEPTNKVGVYPILRDMVPQFHQLPLSICLFHPINSFHSSQGLIASIGSGHPLCNRSRGYFSQTHQRFSKTWHLTPRQSPIPPAMLPSGAGQTVLIPGPLDKIAAAGILGGAMIVLLAINLAPEFVKLIMMRTFAPERCRQQRHSRQVFPRSCASSEPASERKPFFENKQILLQISLM
jgi:hypothetical protein